MKKKAQAPMFALSLNTSQSCWAMDWPVAPGVESGNGGGGGGAAGALSAPPAGAAAGGPLVQATSWSLGVRGESGALGRQGQPAPLGQEGATTRAHGRIRPHPSPQSPVRQICLCPRTSARPPAPPLAGERLSQESIQANLLVLPVHGDTAHGASASSQGPAAAGFGTLCLRLQARRAELHLT